MMLRRVFPFLAWFQDYSPTKLRTDAVAGLTVALVLIPQSMAYAQLAGLPAYYGLYASFLPPLAASLFGSSRQLATGPVAVVSLMTSASLAPLATAGSEAYLAYAVLLALLVGIFQLLLGVLRLGLVVNFLSHPVVNGFTNAAALIIATSQISKLFGVHVDTAEHHYQTVIAVVRATVHYLHWPTLGMAVLAFGIMYTLRKLNPRLPNVLAAVVVTTILSWLIGFEHQIKAPLTAVESAKARTMVQEYNQVLGRLPELAAKRAELTPRILAAKDQAGARSNEVLLLENELRLVELEMANIEEQAGLRREALRALHFRATAEGQKRFYLKEEFPAEQKSDGRLWRLKVGGRPLNEQGLSLDGGGEVVGHVPSGVPALALPKIDFLGLLQLFPYAAIISLLGFMEAISIAKAMAAKTGHKLDPNQELIGQGLANILGALGKSYPTSGSFSRSAVNLQAGATSGVSAVVTSVAVVVTLLFFTPWLYHLPQASLAAVIMMAVIGLINVSGFVHAWHAQRHDGIISVVTFVATLVFAPHLDRGIMIGVALSLGVFLYQSMRPRVATLALAPDCSFRDAQALGLKECQHIAVIRFDGPLFFANASFLEDQVAERINAMPQLRHILLVANGINELDASGEDALSLLVSRVRSAGYDFSISGVKESVLAVLRRTHLYEMIGEDHIFPTQAAAMGAIHGPAHKGSTEKECPLLTVCRLEDYREAQGEQHARS